MRPLHMGFALAVAVLWGGNFVAARIGLSHFPPFFLTSLRFTLVALLLLPFVKRPNPHQLRQIAKISLLNTLHFSLPYVGMSMGLSIASTAITAQLGTPFSCVLGAFFLKDRLGPWRTLGLAIAFGGMFIVFGAPDITRYPTAFLCVLAGAFFWANANIMMKFVQGVGMVQMLAWMSLLSLPPLYTIVWLFEPQAWDSLMSVPLKPMLALGYTVVMSTVFGHGLWYFLLRRCPVSQVVPYSLLTPILGTVFGLWFFGEMVSWHVVAGGLVTLAGVGIIVIRRPKLVPLDETI